MEYRLHGRCTDAKRGLTHEFGAADLDHDGKSPLFKDIPSPTRVWMSHGDEVETLPAGFSVIGTTRDCRNAAVQNLDLMLGRIAGRGGMRRAA